MTPDELDANVDTIVVVVMENRSFDHVLGHLRSPLHGSRADVDGIEDVDNPDYLNPNSDGEGIPPFWTDDRPMPSDLPHGPDGVQTQLAHSDVTGSFAMNGFVKAFEDEFHSSVEQPAVMGLLKPASVPVTGALAAQYTVCDRWFACLPTSTAPNRLMSLCGYSDLRDTKTFVPNQTTVYDWLLDRGIPWRVYAAGFPFFMTMPRLSPLVLTSHFRRLDELPKDMANESAAEWPRVIFVEPEYNDSPVHFQAPCDNHPPLPIAPGEAFLAKVYGWLASDEDRWARTVLILTYDEHGGFFDHVPPLAVKYRNPNGVAFDTTGPRVPAVVAGPFAPRSVSHAALDNTSILQLIAERFGKPGEAYSTEVAGRMHQGIESVSTVLAADAGNTRPLDLSAAAPRRARSAVAPPTAPNDLRRAFDEAAKNLAARHGAEAFAKYPELRDYVASQAPPTLAAVAREHGVARTATSARAGPSKPNARRRKRK